LQTDGVIVFEHPISGGSRVTVELNYEQGSSAQAASFSGREGFDKSRKTMSTASLVGPKNSKRLHAQLRRNRKLAKRAGIRQNDLEEEQSSPVRRVFELKTEGVVANADHKVLEGETEVKTCHFYLEKMGYAAFYGLDVASGVFQRSSVHL